MKILAIQVRANGGTSLAELAAALLALPINERMFPGSDLRLDDANLNGQQVIFLDFAKQRHGHGPGRMARNAPLTEFELAEDESFGEDTGLAVHRATGRAALQFNQYGPRQRGIEDYLNLAALQLHMPAATFDIGQILKPDAYARLGRLGLIKELDFKVSVPAARRADLAEGRSVRELLRAPMPGGIETIQITMNASPARDSSLGPDGVMAIVNDLQRAGDALKRAIVRGRHDDGSKDEINLVEEFLSSEVQLRPARGSRYARQDRWVALDNALRGWLGA